ncbi:MAG: type VI secretion system lipoprotein TssJ [Endozoicomonas sp. (ex Botrylloides leachii)]|nr:type VI secretion system lipoprotein TssJ [Endozoicomonas sp. (ex Botrylloides leachii)]
MLLNHKIFITVVLLMLIAISSCSSNETNKQPKRSLTLNIKADNRINTKNSGQGNPVRIRLYELSNAGFFNEAEFIDLYNSDNKTLQNSLVSKYIMPSILPSESKKVDIDLKNETNFIAILAEFSDYKYSFNKTYVALGDEEKNSVDLYVEGNSVRLTKTL